MSAMTRLDERIDELLFALRSAVEASAREVTDENHEDYGYEDRAWQHARKRLAELLDEVLK